MIDSSNSDGTQPQVTDECPAVTDPFVLELQKEFLNEALFLLEECEESYLKLDNAEVRSEELDKIFRAAHSFKGTGATVGLNDLAAFAHVAENCLSVLRVNPGLLNSEVISLLLRLGDAFKSRVIQLRDGLGGTWNIENLRDELTRATEILQKGLDLRKSSAPAALVSDPLTEEAVHSVNDDRPLKSSAANTIKVDAERIESVLDLIGELVVTKSQLVQSYRQMNIKNSQHDSIIVLLDKSIRELQDRAMNMRMTSLKPLFLKVQRAVRDVSVKLKKTIEFSMTGDEVEVDRTMIDLLGDPLVHIARNAADHGIESETIREGLGKSKTAKITLSARQMGGRVVIQIQDDGGGINRQKVIQRAIEKGILSGAINPDSMSDQDVFKILFAPGFSTSEQISDISGRGVGLDVVKSNIEKLKGSVDIDSKLGQGSKFTISIPLTAAITDGLLVAIGESRYIMALDVVKELIRVNEDDVTQISAYSKIINVRGQLLPLIEAEAILNVTSTLEKNLKRGSRALVIAVGDSQVAFRLDEVLGQVQVVVKPLPDKTTQEKYVTGTAILGDGRVALVLNVDEFLREKTKSVAFEGKADLPKEVA